MVLERTAAYVLVLACVIQALLPSWTIKPHCWRSIDVQIGSLHMQARNEADAACFDELAAEQKACTLATLHSWQKGRKRLKICINDSGCITASLGGISHAMFISKDKKDLFDDSQNAQTLLQISCKFPGSESQRR